MEILKRITSIFRRDGVPAEPAVPSAPLGSASTEVRSGPRDSRYGPDHRLGQEVLHHDRLPPGESQALVQRGLLRDASVIEKLQTFTAADLKPLLKQSGLKVSGRKAELVERLVQGALALCEATVETIDLHVPSEEGEALVAQYGAAGSAFLEATFEALVGGDVELAATLIAEWEAAELFPRGIGIEWSQGMPAPYRRQAAFLLAAPYPELEAAPAAKRRAGAALTLSLLLGEGCDRAGRRVLDALGDMFQVPEIAEHVRRHATASQFLAGHDPERPSDLAALFAQYWLLRSSYGERRQVSSLNDRYSRLELGLQILPGPGDPCAQGKLIFAAHELDQVPALPHTWGCRCTLVPWSPRWEQRTRRR